MEDYESWKNFISTNAINMGINIDAFILEKFSIYAKELLFWNTKTNLTSITSPIEIAEKHFLDSAASLKYIKPNSHILDIGSGAGFPGVVLKIMDPSLRVTLIDSTRKKINFLNHINRVLKLTNITAAQIRIEDFAKIDANKNAFDVVISRAFSNINNFFSLSLPFVSNKGVIIAMKGAKLNEELSEVDISNIKIKNFDVDIFPYFLHYSQSKRNLAIFKKNKE
ncbi:MAG: 16S rRNA (guanine(527)-N(7))-methyltransferase RsmG [Desulfobacterales bacterium]|nr:16S rRNA (guanine(527)-N(7))-methyltransferase RsmG [Desulfobacterales bacterium]